MYYYIKICDGKYTMKKFVSSYNMKTPNDDILFIIMREMIVVIVKRLCVNTAKYINI